MQTKYLFWLFLGFFCSCHQSKPQIERETPANILLPGAAISQPTVALDLPEENDTIVYDRAIFPLDSQMNAKVLVPGTFHEDEINANLLRTKWKGLFKKGDQIYLGSAKIKTARIHDMILDEDPTQKTGWEVSVTNSDTCLLLIESLPYLSNQPVKQLTLQKNSLYPGDTLQFNFLGQRYLIFATGGKRPANYNINEVEVYNYKLHLQALRNGHLVTTLLAAQPFFDGALTYILFAGDIDGDGLLDLLIDTTNDYNAFSPTLYLSKPAEKNSLLKPIASHTSVGC